VLTSSKTITAEDIARCAALTGDYGAHHLPGVTSRPMAQGLLTTAIAPLIRGDRGFFLQSAMITFLVPVFVDDTITAHVRITEATEPADRASTQLRLALSVRNQDGIEVMTGEFDGFSTTGNFTRTGTNEPDE
jgi:acyl dehydratase